MTGIIWAVATYEITPLFSLNELVRVGAGAIGISLHLHLLWNECHRYWILRWAGLNGPMRHIVRTRIENEAIGVVLQVLMVIPAIAVANMVTSGTAQTVWGVAIIWMQAAVSVILALWAWRRRVRGRRLDAMLAESA